jgi:hypothetical protein
MKAATGFGDSEDLDIIDGVYTLPAVRVVPRNAKSICRRYLSLILRRFSVSSFFLDIYY